MNDKTEMLLAITRDEKGQIRMKSELKPREVLQLLVAVTEDVREVIAVQAVQEAAMAAAAQQRVTPVGKGVFGANGKPLI